MKTALIVLSLMIAGIIAAACQTTVPNETNGYSSLISSLQANGAKVSQNGEVNQDFFAVKGKVISVNGNDVQVFEYQSGQKADEDASKISKDGTLIGTSIVTWVDEPHFYKKGNLIVLYIGKNAETIELLEASLGKQIAGKSSKTIKTPKGDLTLAYEDGKAVLNGALERSTPCVSWKVDIITTKDLPVSQVNIKIYDENKNKDIVCIQVVAEPQQINEVIENVNENTKYIITFENEVVFEGKLTDTK